MAATIKHYRSGTADATPTAGNLPVGVLALNYNDGKLFYKNASDAIAEISGSSSGGNLSAQTSDNNGWLEFARSTTSTSGALMKIINNGTEKFSVGYDGSLQLASVASKGTAVTGKFVFDGTSVYIGV